ncbi:IclR family transcriptional regulator [Sphingomonas sp. TF3]|uniref:IclR family transcriptional regulator n=1 Tax=Sphingomonas sp. TF3 TaxID=2495580 RepID=UPI0021B04C96|nr:IclR family transcriptional regulator [Sphingomonas sp. TF3]
MPPVPGPFPGVPEPELQSAASGDGKLGIQSLEIGMRLMAALMDRAFDSPPPMLKTLAASAGMPPAKAHRYMVSLIRSQLVERDEASGRYKLGPMARLMGLRAIQSIDVVRLAGSRLPLICADLGFSVAVAIWAQDGPTIIAVEEARRPITIGTRIGEVMPILSSATGLVFGAWLPRALTRKLIDRDAGAVAGKEAGHASFEREIDQRFGDVVRAGLGTTEGGLNPTVNALSAPIFDHRGVLVAALSTLGPAGELDVSPDGAVAVSLRKFAAELSAELGFTAKMNSAPRGD